MVNLSAMLAGFRSKVKKYKFALKIIAVAAFLTFLGYLMMAGYVYYRRHDGHLTVGVITDIHAGNKKSKEKGSTSGIILPFNFENNLKSALGKMKYDDYIIALGDSVDNGKHCQKYVDRLKEITEGYNMLWVKGNHDLDACFPLLSSRRYFYEDVRDWRIMIIDNSHWYPKDQRAQQPDDIGLIDPEQMDWIKNSLNTDKKILIAMHIPMFDDNGKNPMTLRSDYVDFKKMLEDHGNVKYVLAGHYHNDNWHMEENGINYYILPSLELEGGEGYYMELKLE